VYVKDFKVYRSIILRCLIFLCQVEIGLLPRVFSMILDLKKDEVTWEWRRLCTEELYDLS